MTKSFCMANRFRGQAGFTLFEMIVVITIMSTLAAAYAPRLVAVKQRQEVAREVGKNVTMLVDAAKLFHYNDPDGDGFDWPTLAQLQSYNYINPSWSTNHAFGGSYSVGVSGANFQVAVSNLPADAQNIVRQTVSGWSYDTGTLQGVSTVPPPGFEVSIAHKVNRSGDTMWGDLIFTGGSNGVTIQDSAGNNRVFLGNGGGDLFGLHATDSTGDLYLRGNTSGTSGRVYIRSRNGVQFRDAADNFVAQVASTGAIWSANSGNLSDLTLRDVNPNVPLSNNQTWISYMGIHTGDDLVSAPAIGGNYTNATYRIFVTPTFFEGASTAGDDTYPITSVRCWAEQTVVVPAQPQWRVKINTKDALNNTYGGPANNNQRVLVIITAQV